VGFPLPQNERVVILYISSQKFCWSTNWNTRLSACSLEVWPTEAIGVTSTQLYRPCWLARHSTILWRLCHCHKSVLANQLHPSL